MKNPKTVAKFNTFIADLVAKFGEGKVITHKELDAFWKTGNKEKYPNIVSIRKNPDYLVTRGKYVITASDKPAEVRDALLKKMDEDSKNAASGKLSKELRTNPALLAKAILKSRKTELKPMFENISNELLEEEFSTEDDDVKDILRVHNNS